MLSPKEVLTPGSLMEKYTGALTFKHGKCKLKLGCQHAVFQLLSQRGQHGSRNVLSQISK